MSRPLTNYENELIQVAAVALAAAQCSMYGDTDISDPEGSSRLYKLLNLVSTERQAQEAKWGTRSPSKQEWLTILVEEVGEVARDILETKCPTKA